MKRVVNILARLLPRYNFISYIYGFSMFLLLMPYFTWEHRKLLKLFILPLLFVIGMLNRRKVEKLDLFIIPIFSLFLIYIELPIQQSLSFLLTQSLLVFFIVDRNKLVEYFECFKLFFTISLFLSLITYFLVIFSVPLNYNLIDPLNPLKTVLYQQYTFLVFPDTLLDNLIPRFCGLFDEPGVVGTVAGIILFAERCNLKKLKNIILFVAGIFSFSLFFFILVFVSLLIFHKKKVVFIFLSLFTLFFVLTKEDPVLDKYIWERMEMEDGKLKGDDRSEKGLDEYFERFIHSDNFLWGTGKISYAASASYKQFVIRYGLIFSISVLIFFVVLTAQINKNIKGIFVSLLLFLFLMYQRPFIFDPAYLYLMICAFNIIKRSLNERHAIAKTRKRKIYTFGYLRLT